MIATKVKQIMLILNISTTDTEQAVIIAHNIETKLKELNPAFLDKFINYCEKHFSNPDFKYLTGYQKFVTLLEKFKKGYLELEKKKFVSEKEEEVYKILEKVAKTKPAVEAATLKFIKINYENFTKKDTKEPFFSKNEQMLLSFVSKDLRGVLYQIEAFGKDSVAQTILNRLAQKALTNAKANLLPNSTNPTVSKVKNINKLVRKF